MGERYRMLITEWEDQGTLEQELSRLENKGTFLEKDDILSYFTMILLAVE